MSTGRVAIKANEMSLIMMAPAGETYIVTVTIMVDTMSALKEGH
jgi:hypothetical protein